MTVRELTRFAVGGLWRQKVRTALTLVGVTVGTCAMAFSLALGLGMRAFIDTEFQSRDDFWRVVVHVDEPPADPKDAPPEKIAVRGDVSDARKERLSEALLDRYAATRQRKPPVPLTPEKVAAIAALPDVAEVRTYRSADGRVTAPGSDKPASAFTVSGALTDVQSRLLAGRLPEPGAKEIVVSELVLYDLGRGDDSDLERAIGLPVRLEVGGIRNAPPLALARALTGHLPGDDLTAAQLAVLEKVVGSLPAKLDAFDLTPAERLELQKLFTAKRDDDERPAASGATVADEFRVCGVVRVLTREDRKKLGPLTPWEVTRANVFLAPDTGGALFAKLPWTKEGAYYAADVRVRPGGDLPAAVAAIEGMGFRTFSAAKWFTSAKREVTLIAMGLNLFALIALFVAAVGITNTLVTSVVERTAEIGILRAIGATRAQIQGMFLTEGTFIGLLGSALGLALARALAVPADVWVQGIMQSQMEGETLHSTTIFVFPLWLWLASVAFAVLLTTAAAYYPARRAARIHPIEALRYG
ncbi:ABC transporter permease [Gemmata sp.]|uniref:ABC transporter permease n=1 Tax=Gemmata sp. TaxID=1914242 RepID=UPI003F6E7345